MQEIIDTLHQLFDPATVTHNIGIICVLIWLPACVVVVMALRSCYRTSGTPEMMPLMASFPGAIAIFTMVGGWQAFEHLPLGDFAMLTGAQIAVVLLIFLLDRPVSRLMAAKMPVKKDKSKPQQLPKRFCVFLVLFGLLLAGSGSAWFYRYVTAEVAVATVVSLFPEKPGRPQAIRADWKSPDGKTFRIALGFDDLDAFRPKAVPGMQLPFRLTEPPETGGDILPFYKVDMGLPAVFLYNLSIVFWGVTLLYSALLIRRKSIAPAPP